MPAAWGLRAATVIAALSVAVPASAADAPGGRSNTTAEARHSAELQYRKGVTAYAAGRFTEAIEYFRRADSLSPSAALSFNTARAYEKLSDPKATLAWYRDYLRRSPDASDADQVGQVVRRLETELAQSGLQQMTVISAPEGATVLVDGRAVGITPWTGELASGNHQVSIRSRGFADVDRLVTVSPAVSVDLDVTMYPDTQASLPFGSAVVAAPPSAEKKDESHPLRPLRTAGFIALGTGAAALGGAIVFELLRASAEDDGQSEPQQVRAREHFDTAESRATAARVLLGAGIVTAAAGGVLLVLDARKRESAQPRVSLGCTGGLCGVTAFGRFQ